MTNTILQKEKKDNFCKSNVKNTKHFVVVSQIRLKTFVKQTHFNKKFIVI